jgi:hypothetical protein
VAVPSLKKRTRKSRAFASRAVVSQQTSVAIPEDDDRFDATRSQYQFEVGPVEGPETGLLQHDVARVNVKFCEQRSGLSAPAENFPDPWDDLAQDADIRSVRTQDVRRVYHEDARFSARDRELVDPVNERSAVLRRIDEVVLKIDVDEGGLGW